MADSFHRIMGSFDREDDSFLPVPDTFHREADTFDRDLYSFILDSETFHRKDASHKLKGDSFLLILDIFSIKDNIFQSDADIFHLDTVGTQIFPVKLVNLLTRAMSPPAEPSSAPVIPLEFILTAVSDLTRWRIFDALLGSEPLPVAELAKRLHVPGTNISKHVTVLRQFGLLRRGFGNLYSIPTAFLVPGERALDFGAVVLRLDRLHSSETPG